MGIRNKLIILSLILAGVPFAAAGAYLLSRFDAFAGGAIDAGTSLGQSVLEDSRGGMEAMARSHLAGAAAARAATLDAELRSVEASLRTLAVAYAAARQAGGTGRTEATAAGESPAVYFLPKGIADPDGSLRRLLEGVEPVLAATAGAGRHVEAAGIAAPEGAFAMVPGNRLPEDYDPRTRSWHVAARERPGQIAWVKPYISASRKTLIVTGSITVAADPGGTEPGGCVFIDLNLAKLAGTVLESRLPQATTFLLDGDGDIIIRHGMTADAAWDERVALRNLSASGTPEEQALAGRMIRGETGEERGTLFGGEDAFVAFAPVAATGWSVGVVVPAAEVLATVRASAQAIDAKTAQFREGGRRYARELIAWFLTLGAGGALLIVIICIAVSRRVTHPLAELASGARAIGGGDFERTIRVHTGDELQELAATINTMSGSLKTYMENLARTVAAKERIEQELAVAAQIQLSMLPREFPPFPERMDIDLHAVMTPAREVGGDFYDYFFVDGETLWFCVGDVCGKGIPAALFMAIAKTLLGEGAARLASPAAVLHSVNAVLARNNDNCMFATVFCGFLNVRTGAVRYANAGHNPPVVRHADGSATYHQPASAGMPIGPMEQPPEMFRDETLTLARGEALLLYTDGVTEAFDPDGAALGEERFVGMFRGPFLPARPLVDGLMGEVRVFVRGAEQSDDITMLAILLPA